MDTDRTWRQVDSVSFQNGQDDGAVQEQVARSIRAVSTGGELRLPEIMQAHIEESILKAIREYAAGERGEPAPDPLSQAIQVAIHLEAAKHAPDLPDPTAPRWGYFLVQKPGQRPASAQLLLDLYLYQE